MNHESTQWISFTHVLLVLACMGFIAARPLRLKQDSIHHLHINYSSLESTNVNRKMSIKRCFATLYVSVF